MASCACAAPCPCSGSCPCKKQDLQMVSSRPDWCPPGTGPHAYPDIYHPTSPHPQYHLHPIFAEGKLFDQYNKPVSWCSLKGKSVALFVGYGNCRKCRNFLPFLLNFYRTINENSNHQKIEVIYVPLDESEEEFRLHRARQPWLSLKWQDPHVRELQAHFKVFTPPEIPKFGFGPRTIPPALLVIGSDGHLYQELDVHVDYSTCLRFWDLTGFIF